MTFELTILGTNSALPAYGRHPTAQVLEVQDSSYLIDCGEGTQMRMDDFNVRRGKIGQIFISHLHGDHIYGLIGLLTSYALLGREEPMDIFSPEGLQQMIEVQISYAGGGFPFPVRFHVINPEEHQLIFENQVLAVHSIPLVHRVPTCGFLFREKSRPLNILPEQIERYEISIPQIKAIKAGKDLKLDDGRIIPNDELTVPSPKPRSFAYCSDTRYNERIVPLIEGVDMLYHESTFLHDSLARAEQTLHSTAYEAATIARTANVRQLILGHYSSRYPDPNVFLEEALNVFDRTVLGIEGQSYSVPFRRRKLESR